MKPPRFRPLRSAGLAICSAVACSVAWSNGAERTSTAASPTTWRSEVLERDVPLRFHHATLSAPAPVVIRLFGHGDDAHAEPVSTWLERGFAVLDIAYPSLPAAPHRDLLQLRRQAAAWAAPLGLDPDRVYLIPAGYRLATDVPFYRNGSFQYRFDVAFPARGPAAPAVVQFSHRVEGRRDAATFTRYTDTWLDALACRGYATVLVDHHGADRPERRLDDYDLLLAHGRATLAAIGAGASGWRIDPTRLALLGFSKGGATAALLAAHPAVDSPPLPRVRAAVVVGAYLDQASLLRDGINPRSLRWRDALEAWGDPERSPDLWRRASSISYVDKADPPMLVVAGEADEYRPAQAKRFAAALAAAGVAHELILVPGLGHTVPLEESVTTRVEAFLGRALTVTK